MATPLASMRLPMRYRTTTSSSEMTSSGSSSGSVWENWIRDHGTWMAESRAPGEFIAKLLWTPFGAASTGCAAYCDELARHPAGTLTKTAGVALSALIPGAGLLGVAADAAAIATGQVIGSGLNDDDDRLAADRRHRLANQQTLQRQSGARAELDSLFG